MNKVHFGNFANCSHMPVTISRLRLLQYILKVIYRKWIISVKCAGCAKTK